MRRTPLARTSYAYCPQRSTKNGTVTAGRQPHKRDGSPCDGAAPSCCFCTTPRPLPARTTRAPPGRRDVVEHQLVIALPAQAIINAVQHIPVHGAREVLAVGRRQLRRAAVGATAGAALFPIAGAILSH